MKPKTKQVNCGQVDAIVGRLKSKLSVLICSQIYALRKRHFKTQKKLANAANMRQSHISEMERPGFANPRIDTLIRLAAVFKCGLIIKFVPYKEMLDWDNKYSQDKLMGK